MSTTYLGKMSKAEFMRLERKVALFSQVWMLTDEEQEQLDKHFLCRTTFEDFDAEISMDPNDFYKDKINIGGTRYTVHYHNCTYNWLHDKEEYEGNGIELVISCRAFFDRAAEYAIAIVQPRWEKLSDAKYLAIREMNK